MNLMPQRYGWIKRKWGLQKIYMNEASENFSKDLNKEDFSKLYEESLKKQKEITQGEIVIGEIIHIGKDFAIIDIGYKSEGQVYLSEFINARGEVEAQVGDKVDVYIENIENFYWTR